MWYTLTRGYRMAKERSREVPVEEMFKRITAEISRLREEAQAQKLNFTAPTEEQIWKKLTKKGSPMIVGQSWSGQTNPGGTFNYTVTISNPDPVQRIWMFDHVFIGPANMVKVVGRALLAVDERFPRLTQPDFPGLSIASGASDALKFSIQVPNNVEPGNYLGNSFLFGADWHDIGEYFDRAVFVFEVS